MKYVHLACSSSLLKITATFFFVALLMSGGATQAGTITGYAGSSGTGLGVVNFGAVSSPNPGNDDAAGASPNTIVVTEKRFDTFNGIWMIFDVASDGLPGTEYQMTETVTNNTGGIWIGYQVMLGTGTDSGWVQQALGTGLDFDMPDDNSPRSFSVLPTIVYDEVTIDAVGAMILPGETHVFTYAIDVPDGMTQFTIRTSPREFVVPVEAKTWGGIKALFR